MKYKVLRTVPIGQLETRLNYWATFDWFLSHIQRDDDDFVTVILWKVDDDND
jgi:hypothetical protein